jgi:hypothetical protein
VRLMKNTELEKPDCTGRIEAAMAVIRQGAVTRAPAPETFDLHCVCAREDKPYTLRFVRQPSGLLRFRESVKGKPSSLPDNARAGGVGWTMRLDYFENGPTPCAWCGDASFHHCANDCGALVCGGRMNGNTFHCRKSCGASWVGVPLREVKGTVTREPARACPGESRGAFLSPARRPTACPAKPMLLLPAGRETRGGR